MKIKKIEIKNFRGLEQVSLNCGEIASVIVGPNAIGKSSIFEAIRLSKALLTPSFPTEMQETLQDMRVWSPFGNAINVASVTGDDSQPCEITTTIALTETEVSRLEHNRHALTQLRVRNMKAVPPNADELSLIQFLSSPEGRKQLAEAEDQIRPAFEQLSASRTLTIGLAIDGRIGQIIGKNQFDQEALTVLHRSVPPTHAYLSYFPADRSLPVGEVNIQLGTPDLQEQQRSHTAIPTRKFQRLKNYLVTQHISGADATSTIREDFELIFRELLPGKSLDRLEVSQYGPISVLIKEATRGRTFDVDSMSSGEKGLILMFLLMRRTLAPGGILLVDEPELHLNPSVCKKLLPFIIEHVVKPLDAQIIITTHSAEILGLAYDREDCSLFHLRGRRDISPIYAKDRSEVFEALKKLGVQTSDVLFNKGTINVEGDQDIDLLEVGFQNRIHGYKVVAYGGRNEIEKEIRSLQKQEQNGLLETKICFIFDLDEKPTDLQSTARIRIAQWSRYCFENFLLDVDAIYDARQTLGSTNSEVITRGQLNDLMKQLAFEQIRMRAARDTYRKREIASMGFRPTEIEKLEDFQSIGRNLLAKLTTIKSQLDDVNPDAWLSSYISECEALEKKLKEDWESKWQTLCDGKSLLKALHKRLSPNASVAEFKATILRSMEKERSELWSVVDSTLSNLVEN